MATHIDHPINESLVFFGETLEELRKNIIEEEGEFINNSWLVRVLNEPIGVLTETLTIGKK